MESKKSISNLAEMTTVIQSLLRIYNTPNSSDKIKEVIYKTIHTLLSPDHWGEKHAVSEKAQKFVKTTKYKKPLDSSSWADLGHKELKVDDKKGHNGTRGLILEHIILRGDIMDLLLKCNPDDKKEIEKIIRNTKCAVIHWKEDDELTKNKKGNKRPNPIQAYEEAKVKLIYPDGKDISQFIDLDWVEKKIASLY